MNRAMALQERPLGSALRFAQGLLCSPVLMLSPTLLLPLFILFS